MEMKLTRRSCTSLSYETDLLLGRSCHLKNLKTFIIERRKRQEVYRKEFEVLTSKIEAGESKDDERYYFLELIEKQRLGHSLSEEELADIEDFEAEEDETSPVLTSIAVSLEHPQLANKPANTAKVDTSVPATPEHSQEVIQPAMNTDEARKYAMEAEAGRFDQNAREWF